jgi:hypothetical protein
MPSMDAPRRKSNHLSYSTAAQLHVGGPHKHALASIQ